MVRSLIKEDMDFVREGNIFHFLKDDASRPAWSRALDDYLTGNHINLMMKRKYSGQKRRMARMRHSGILLNMLPQLTA